MASKLAKRAPAPTFSKASPKLARLQATLASRAATARRVASERQGMLVSAVAAGLVGYAERKQMALPTIAGIDPALLYGGIGAFAAGTLVRGSAGRMLGQAADGALAVAAYKLGAGQPVLSGELGAQWEEIP